MYVVIWLLGERKEAKSAEFLNLITFNLITAKISSLPYYISMYQETYKKSD